MKTKTLISTILITLFITIPSFSQTDLTREAIRFALSTFNPALSQQEYQHQVQGILNRVLHEPINDEIARIYSDNQFSEYDQQREIMKSVARTTDVSFIVMRDGSTYWTDLRRGQELRFNENTFLRGNVMGEQVEMTLKEMKDNLLSIEFSFSNPKQAVLTRNDGIQFVMNDFDLKSRDRPTVDARLRYIYPSPVTGSEQEIRIWGNWEQIEGRNFIKLIVFGLNRPKMNPLTQAVFPPDYTFDPYDGSVLVPVEWQGATHRTNH